MITTPAKTGPKNAIFLTICTMGLFAILSTTMSKSPVLNPFAVSLGTPTDWLGIVASASTIPGILISLPAASLSDIFGRRRFFLIAGVVFASAPFLYLLITVWWELIIVRFYHGFATAIFVPVAEASIAELYPANRGAGISLFSSVTYVGRVIAPLLGGSILFITGSNYVSLYLAVAVAGIAALLMALPLLSRKPGKNIKKEEDKKQVKLLQGWTHVVTRRGVLLGSFAQASQYYVYGSAEFFLAGYLPKVASLNELETGIILTSMIAIGIFARPYMGSISDRIGRRIPIIAGCTIASLPFFIIPFVRDFWILLGLTMLFGFGFATSNASTPALVSESAPRELIGSAMGFLDTIMDVGQTLGPIISAFVLATTFRYEGVFASLGVVLISTSAIFSYFVRGPKAARP